MLGEEEGRAVLKRCFEAAGLAIAVDHALADVPLVLDGYDATRRVGYEFITTDAGDRLEVTPQVVAELERRMAAGELAVLLIDERDVAAPVDLEAGARAFLEEARRRGFLP